MQLSQFRTLIREEVKRVLREARRPVSQKVKDEIYNELIAGNQRGPARLRRAERGLKDLFRLAGDAYDKYHSSTFENAIFGLVDDGKIEHLGKDKWGQNIFKIK
jgi:hypothetical protein